MMMRRPIIALALVIGLCSVAAAGNFLFFGVGSNSGTGPAPCAAGQLDFSDATGCNLTLYMVILK